MDWQDIALTVAGVLFFPSLIPMIRAEAKPPLKSSLGTLLGLSIIQSVNVSMAWWVATVTNALTMSAWATLVIQKIRQKGGRA